MAKARRTRGKRNLTKRRAPRAKRTAKRAKATRSLPKKVSKGVVKTSGAASHHAVMRMPFSTATSQPKIPDGKVATSLSRRLQKVVQIQNANGAATIDLVMVPSLGVCGVAYGSTNPQGTRVFEAIGFSGQTVGLDGSGLPGTNRVSNIGSITNWRIVSQGMKFQLNQTEEENDGWFEAVRFNAALDYAQWGLANLDNTLNNGSLGLFPGVHFKSLVVDPLAANMVEHPGYTTGLLKDIHKHEFKLNPKTNSVGFKTLKTVYSTIDAGGAAIGTWDAPNAMLTFSNFKPETEELFNGVLDHDYDMILLRLHCRANNGTTSNGSKLIMNAIQNIEFCFAPSSDLVTFQTSNVSDKRTSSVVDELNDRTQAGGR